MFGLIRNEVLKIHKKRRLLVVSVILIVLVSMFTYANYRQIEKQREEQGTIDWRVDLQQEIVDTQNRLASANVQDEFRQILEFQVQQNQYYLDNDINPNYPGADIHACLLLARDDARATTLYYRADGGYRQR